MQLFFDQGLWVGDVSLSGDGRLALSSDGLGTVRLWDATTGALLRTMIGHEDSADSVSLSADGRLAMSGSRDDTIRLWKIGRSDDTTVPSTADANAGGNQTVTSTSTVTLDGSDSTDSRAANGKPIAYYWRQLAPTGTTLSAADTVTLSANNTEMATFTAPAVTSNTSLRFALTVTDPLGVVDTEEVTITVTAASGSASRSLTEAAPRQGSTIAPPSSEVRIPSPTKVVSRSNPGGAISSNATSAASPTCASVINEVGRALRGWMHGAHCIYPASLLGADNALETDMTIPALPNGGAHIFQGSLVVGRIGNINASSAAMETVGGAPVLTVEAGAVLAFEGVSSALVVNRGAHLSAVGSADKPIILTSRDNVDGNSESPEEVSRWGGIEINGFDVEDTSGQGTDGSGRLEYVVVKHVATNSAITLRGVGSGTVVRNLQVYDAVGDGLVLVGGAANVENFVAVYVRGDGIGIGAGWFGTLSSALVIEPERGGSHCLNARDLDASGGLDIQDRSAIVRGLTCIISPDGRADDNQNPNIGIRPGAGIRLGAGPVPTIERSLVVGTFHKRGGYCLRTDNRAIRETRRTREAEHFALSGNIFACGDKIDGDATVAAWAASGNNQFADVKIPTDPTAAADTHLQLLGGTPPVYSLTYDELQINGADTTVTSPDGIDFPGAVSESDASNWLRPNGIDWTYGIFEGSRAKPLWFESDR